MAVETVLAHAFLSGPWERDGLVERGARVLGRETRWLVRVVDDVLAAYRAPPLDRPRELAGFLRVVGDPFAIAARLAPLLGEPEELVALGAERLGWRPRWLEDLAEEIRRDPDDDWDAALRVLGKRPGRAGRYLPFEQRTLRRPWPVPPIDTVTELAAFLDLHLGELLWLADARGLERSVAAEKLRNYRYTWIPRRGAPPRVIEQPKASLKAAQRRVLHELLEAIPPHDAAHGFRRGRSVGTHAAAHLGRRFVLRFDLEDFFASVDAGRVFGIFRTAGYPESVAHQLTALSTNVVPAREWAAVPRPREPSLVAAHARLGARLRVPHLPQGAPTSPALASLAAFRLDRRLAGLAAGVGATYTRYADDLALSGDVRVLRVRPVVPRIAREEGFRVNERKSQLMSRAGRQRLCGVVVNERPNVPRAEYDRLKAILHNAAHRGPAAENRAGVADFRAHLLGRIAWVESLNPEHGAKLRERFARIAWD